MIEIRIFSRLLNKIFMCPRVPHFAVDYKFLNPEYWDWKFNPGIGINNHNKSNWIKLHSGPTTRQLLCLTTVPSVDTDVLPPSNSTRTWELTSADCSSVNSTGDSNTCNTSSSSNNAIYGAVTTTESLKRSPGSLSVPLL